MDFEPEIEQAVTEHVTNVKAAGQVEPDVGRNFGVGSIWKFAAFLTYGLPPLPSPKVGSGGPGTKPLA
jgi:hypothetical protein